MQFTLLTTLALFAVSALAQDKDLPLAQQAINQCKPTTLTYDKRGSSFNIIVTSAAQPCGEPLQVIGDHTSTKVEWTPNSKIRAGQKVLVSVLSDTGYEGWSQEIVVGAGDNSCITGSSSSASSSSATSSSSAANLLPTGSTTTTTTTTTDDNEGEEDPDSPEVIGAAKAAGGILGSGAVSTRVAAPVMALSALAGLAVLAL